MPTAPPAPVRFTTTTGCLSAFSICAASGRPTMSATPPGGNGTIIVIGFAGYESCAFTGSARASSSESSTRDIGLLRSDRAYTMLQMLHFIGSLAGRGRVKCRGTKQTGGCHAEETDPRRRRPRAVRPGPCRPRARNNRGHGYGHDRHVVVHKHHYVQHRPAPVSTTTTARHRARSTWCGTRRRRPRWSTTSRIRTPAPRCWSARSWAAPSCIAS